MKEYKFKNQFQIESEQKKAKALKEAKELTKGKKLLKEATFTVTTVDDALATIAECMEMIAIKKRSPLLFCDLIASSIISGLDAISTGMTKDDTERGLKVGTQLKKRIILTIRNSFGL